MVVVLLSTMSVLATHECSDTEIFQVETFEITYIDKQPEQNTEEELIEKAWSEFEDIINERDTTTDKKEWYVNRYLRWTEKYKNIIDLPETIFDYYSDEEIELIYRCVETECFEGDFNSKCNVASVIWNRINNGGFGDSVQEVITNENQFCYGRKCIDIDTILAVMYTFEIEDTTDGCLFFENTKSDIHRLNYEYVFTDDIGHKFFRYREVV